jgi:tRNA G18 (ribose-2'-O)-methylase SpoU
MENRKLKLDELNRVDINEYKDQKKFPIIILLDNVRSALNVGSVFRTCDAFAIEELGLCGITATPPNKEIMKTALGATESVKWKKFDDTIQSIEYYKKRGYKIYALEQAENTKFLNEFNFNLHTKIVLIFGNEVEGIQQDIIDLCDAVIEIPQFGTKHSLNISVSAGIAILEAVKEMKKT